MKKKKKAAIGISGGVDSAVAAALLLEEGYDVIGLTMITDSMPEVVDEARATIRELGLDHHIIDLTIPFKNMVVDYFISSYKHGKTPNPCITCNHNIKFGLLMTKALELGAEYFATGHYVRLGQDTLTEKKLLLRGVDIGKDQSYFLYRLNQSQLEKCLFPLGDYTKSQVKAKAKSLGLSSFKKSESQEICFIPNNDYKKYIRTNIDPMEIKKGHFLDTENKIIGSHQGIINYTVGQRRGLGLAFGYPAYVVSIDSVNNTVKIGKEEDLYNNELISVNNNFIIFDKVDSPLEVEAKIRSTSVPAAAVLIPCSYDKIRVCFETPQRAITPGQSIVYYHGDILLGGGIIEQALYSSIDKKTDACI